MIFSSYPSCIPLLIYALSTGGVILFFVVSTCILLTCGPNHQELTRYSSDVCPQHHTYTLCIPVDIPRRYLVKMQIANSYKQKHRKEAMSLELANRKWYRDVRCRLYTDPSLLWLRFIKDSCYWIAFILSFYFLSFHNLPMQSLSASI